MHQNETQPGEEHLGYLIWHDEYGVWLGGDAQQQFWANVPPHPFVAAPVLDTAQACQDMILSWHGFMRLPRTADERAQGAISQAQRIQEDTQRSMDKVLEGLRIARVVPDLKVSGMRFASVEACLRAGLPGWTASSTAADVEDHVGERPSIH